ncbi:hypothetical protein AMECASPLE_012897 [Ameca splendens]|uniref:Uncharacterized protein n=1 Tax=Ameca splendens TaxID=208324 RepID=A0ABV0ZNI9_9TELE
MVLWNETHLLQQIAKTMFTRISNPKTVDVFVMSTAKMFLEYFNGLFACCSWLTFPFQRTPMSHCSYGTHHTHPSVLICLIPLVSWQTLLYRLLVGASRAQGSSWTWFPEKSIFSLSQAGSRSSWVAEH